ncbi:MAG: hypothetical protein WAU81_01015 [Candidatus Aminicenantales bacterium]
MCEKILAYFEEVIGWIAADPRIIIENNKKINVRNAGMIGRSQLIDGNRPFNLLKDPNSLSQGIIINPLVDVSWLVDKPGHGCFSVPPEQEWFRLSQILYMKGSFVNYFSARIRGGNENAG